MASNHPRLALHQGHPALRVRPPDARPLDRAFGHYVQEHPAHGSASRAQHGAAHHARERLAHAPYHRQRQGRPFPSRGSGHAVRRPFHAAADSRVQDRQNACRRAFVGAAVIGGHVAPRGRLAAGAGGAFSCDALPAHAEHRNAADRAKRRRARLHHRPAALSVAYRRGDPYPDRA